MHVSVLSTSVSHRIIKSCSELKLPFASTRTICIINTIYLSAPKLWFLIKGALTQFEIKKNHLFCVKWFTCSFCMIDQNLKRMATLRKPSVIWYFIFLNQELQNKCNAIFFRIILWCMSRNFFHLGSARFSKGQAHAPTLAGPAWFSWM